MSDMRQRSFHLCLLAIISLLSAVSSAEFRRNVISQSVEECAFSDLSVSDLDNDGDMDIHYVDCRQEKFWIQNKGPLPFSAPQALSSVPVQSQARMHFIDMDGDGDMDTVRTNSAFTGLHDLYLNDSPISSKRTGFVGLYPVDLDLDGDMDILGLSTIDRETLRKSEADQKAFEDALGDVLGTLEGDDILNPASAKLEQPEETVGDLEINWDPDKLSPPPDENKASSKRLLDVYKEDFWNQAPLAQTGGISDPQMDDRIQLDYFENNGRGGFDHRVIAPYLGQALSASGECHLTAIDFDQDGDLDIFALKVTDSGHDSLFRFENDGSRHFTAHTVDNVNDADGKFYFMDFDGDRDLDLLISSLTPAFSALRLFVNQGNGKFDQKILYSKYKSGISPEGVPADIDSDGDMDIIYRERLAISREISLCVLLNNTSESGVPSISILSPKRNEMWKAYTMHTIRWTTSRGIERVNIEYHSGGAWRTVASGIPNTGAFSWKKIAPLSGAGIIRVSDAKNDSVYALTRISTSRYEVPGSLRCAMRYRPDRVFAFGDEINIRWKTTGDMGQMKIEYTHDEGRSWTTIVESTEDDQVYPWTAPWQEMQHARFRISSLKYPQIKDTTDWLFYVMPGTIDIAAPGSEGALRRPGEKLKIRWLGAGDLGMISIDFFDSLTGLWTRIADSLDNAGEYTWSLPPELTGHGVLRAASLKHLSIAGYSGQVSITHGMIHVNTPDYEDQEFLAGDTLEIRWTSQGDAVRMVNIDYAQTGSAEWLPIETNTENDGLFRWALSAPAGMERSSGRYRIRVRSAAHPEIAGTGSLFGIKDIIILSPSEGERLVPGTETLISWQTSGPPGFIDLEYSLDDGLSWTYIKRNISTFVHGSNWTWNVPREPSDQVRIRISLSIEKAIHDQSRASFSIMPPAEGAFFSGMPGDDAFAAPMDFAARAE